MHRQRHCEHQLFIHRSRKTIYSLTNWVKEDVMIPYDECIVRILVFAFALETLTSYASEGDITA